MNNSKAKGIGIGLLVGAVLVGLVGSLSYLTKGFVDWTFADISIPGISISDTSSEDSSSDSNSDSEPAGLALIASKTLFQSVGDTITLTATVSPANASDKRVTWASSDVSKVNISNSTNTSTGGTVLLTCEAIFEGTVTVTATTVDGGFEATCGVNYYEAIDSLEVVVSSRNYNTTGEPFLYYNGSEYFARDYDSHPEDEFHLDLVVAPSSATLATSFSRLLASNWISSTSSFVSAPSALSYYGAANSYAAGDISYDAEDDIAIIPLRFAADFSSIQGGTITFTLDGLTASFDVELYIAVSGVSVNPPTHTF
ncbi:MAG: Ig-like domain-containing protein [Bacilli bacterium]|nr:Ig-like domain-containing protein [Bacilli bacterium]